MRAAPKPVEEMRRQLFDRIRPRHAKRIEPFSTRFLCECGLERRKIQRISRRRRLFWIPACAGMSGSL
jgi:hypothetical protein